MTNTKKAIRDSILENVGLIEDMDDEELKHFIEDEYLKVVSYGRDSFKERKQCTFDVFNSLRRMGVIEELIEDDTVTEILINGPRDIFYERAGSLHRFDGAFEDEEELDAFAQMMIGMNNRTVNAASPIADGRLRDGSRVNVVMAPVSVGGTAVSIRRFPKEVMTMQKLKEFETLSDEVDDFLKKLVKAGYNIFISGGTGTGKTSLLNALAEYIPKDERVVTIEDSAELQLKKVENLVSLESRTSSTEGVCEITIRDLIRTALRMRPEPPHYKIVKIRALKKESPHPRYTPAPLP
ncbi:MAG: Flp pilus assembly complex ATPase component TadA [Lachnospiraceae bacterium]|nr:Flp pilus assembly complex ATPase component TadA [Lachnospiraceae bacterium]